MNLAKGKAKGIAWIGVTQSLSNLTWAASDWSSHLGGARVGFHGILMILAMVEMIFGRDLYNHCDDAQWADAQHEDDAYQLLNLICWKAPAVGLVGTFQLITNIAWMFSDAQVSLGIVRIAAHLALASLAVIEISLAYDLWRRLKYVFREREKSKGMTSLTLTQQ